MENSNAVTNALGTQKLSKLMVKYSLPCIASLLVGALYNMVDQIFIGNSELSTLGNAATGVVFPIFIVAQACAWCVGDGCAAYLNICHGQKKMDKVPSVIGTGITVTLLSSIVIMLFAFPLRSQILLLFGASANNMDMAIEYYNIIVAFFPAFMLSHMMNSVIRADGSPAYAMISMLAGAAANIILDPVFIFGLKWGMTGAALATILGQVTSFVMCAVYYIKPKTFKINFKNLLPDFKAFKTAFILGLSPFITQITILIVTVVLNAMLAKYGAMSQYGEDIPLAVMGIANKVFVVVINTVVGVVLGCQPIVSYNMGAKKYKRVKTLYKSLFTCALVIGLVATAFFELAPDLIIKMFGTPTNIPNPDDYWVFARLMFRIYLMFITFTCISKVNAIFFQAAGKSPLAIIASMIRDIVCLVPLAFILPAIFGIEGILFSAPVADFISIIVSMVLMIKWLKSIPNEDLT